MTEQVDPLVVRLLEWAGNYEEGSFDTEETLMREAAARIAALEVGGRTAIDAGEKLIATLTSERNAAEARLADALAALKPFAEFAEAGMFDRLPDDMPMTQGSGMARRQVTAGDFKRARDFRDQFKPDATLSRLTAAEKGGEQ